MIQPELEFTWVSTMPGNVKNAIHGVYHAIHGKHLGRYPGGIFPLVQLPAL